MCSAYTAERVQLKKITLNIKRMLQKVIRRVYSLFIQCKAIVVELGDILQKEQMLKTNQIPVLMECIN